MEEAIVKWTNVRSDISDSSSSTLSFPASKRGRLEEIRPTKFKGVVPQNNGNWGAQIYANNQRIWLGTFKTDNEAAMAYYRAAIKLRGEETTTYSNVPWTSYLIKERNFQSLHCTEEILDMIRDGSYQSKFSEFARDKNSQGTETSAAPVGAEGVIPRLLFQKELTPSDVGKLNRIVIPKKHAVKCFSNICEEENGWTNDIELEFYDMSMKAWRFRYCYWNSSQTFVFTKGWSRFVKEKRLRPEDVVLFYVCESRDRPDHAFFMIDTKMAENISQGGVVVAGEVVSASVQVDMQLPLGQKILDNVHKLENAADTSVQVDMQLRLGQRILDNALKLENAADADVEENPSRGTREKGVMLFGNLIYPNAIL